VREGVDDVFVVHAASVDEARAEVALFYASIAQPASATWKAEGAATPLARYRGLPVVRMGEETAKKTVGAAASGRADAGEAPKPAAPPGGAAPEGGRRWTGEAPPPSGPSAGTAGAVPQESQVVLGSFLLDLSPDEWTRATARLDAAEARNQVMRVEAGAKVAPPAGAAPPPTTPSEGYLAKAREKDKEGAPPPAPGTTPVPPPVPAPAAEPAVPEDAAMGEAGAADGKGVRRRVRILVVPPTPTSGR
jgi:hypothetical protein